VSYTGVDVSSMIIKKNRKRYASEKIKFDVILDPHDIECGVYDLILIKDVFRHCPNEIVLQYLSILPRITKFALITNDEAPSSDVHVLNCDIPGGHSWRPIDIRREPFLQKSAVIAEYVNFLDERYWVKRIHLLVY